MLCVCDFHERAPPLPTHSLRLFLEEGDSALPIQLRTALLVCRCRYVAEFGNVTPTTVRTHHKIADNFLEKLFVPRARSIQYDRDVG